MLELNKIYCMDCLEGMKQLEDNSVDLIVTDPPYNTGMRKTCGKAWLCHMFDDDYEVGVYHKLVRNVCRVMYSKLKVDRGGYIFINWKQLGTWIYNLEKVGFKVKNTIVWDKIVHGLNYQNYAHTYELIIFFVKGCFFPYNKPKNFGKPKYFKDIWSIQRQVKVEETKTEHHETVKSEDVVRIPILHGSKENDLILDPFMGSGTTAVICKQLHRNFIGFEINPEYVEIANERLQQKNLNSYLNNNKIIK